jgi:6-phosphofructokinase 1
LSQIERDPYGNVRLAELELSRLLKGRVTASLGARGIATSIVAKDIGYELRCAPPGGFDIHYCRGLGYWATRFLLEGGTDAMVTMQGDTFVPVPFRELIDAKTGTIPRASRRREVGRLPDARRLHDPTHARGPRGSRAGQRHGPRRRAR